MEAARVIEKNIQEYENAVKPGIHLVEADQEQSKTGKGYAVMKRAFDVALSALSLVILSPVFLITAAAIKLEDGGPVIFKQKRVGKNQEIFDMYKFRSMRVNADKIHAEMAKEMGNTDVSFKMKDDPRITKTGKIIRKTSIDELPQLINILKGEMSVVGPRPLPVYEYEEEQEKYGSLYNVRYTVKQGLTCYWQVSGRSENVPFEERMQQDVQYVREAGMWRDIKIIMKTFAVVFTGKGAY